MKEQLQLMSATFEMNLEEKSETSRLTRIRLTPIFELSGGSTSSDKVRKVLIVRNAPVLTPKVEGKEGQPNLSHVNERIPVDGRVEVVFDRRMLDEGMKKEPSYEADFKIVFKTLDGRNAEQRFVMKYVSRRANFRKEGDVVETE